MTFYDPKEIIVRETICYEQGVYPVCVQRQVGCMSIEVLLSKVPKNSNGKKGYTTKKKKKERKKKKPLPVIQIFISLSRKILIIFIFYV